jgi:hypothetical protein
MSECPSKLPGVQRIARNMIHGPTVDTRSWRKLRPEFQRPILRPGRKRRGSAFGSRLNINGQDSATTSSVRRLQKKNVTQAEILNTHSYSTALQTYRAGDIRWDRMKR